MIVVNPATRQFNVPGADLVFGVTSDSGSERKHFQCPRYVGNNVDIASSFVRMNYRNGNGEIDSYLVEDLRVDGDNVLFSWVLSPKVTMYKGNINFVMCVVGPDTKVAWHTTLGRGQVLEGLEPDSHMVEEGTADVIAALLALVQAQSKAVADKGAEWVRNVQLEGTDQIVAVQTAGVESKSAAVAEIEAKRANSLASIPADYTALGNAVESLVRGRAGAIVCEAEGTAIAVKDASENYLQGLRIFGRSTQNGTPTPDAPVEIVSFDAPTVRVTGKNLFPGHVKNYTGTDGSTVVVNEDGSITVHKVVGPDLSFRENLYFPAGTYVLSNGLSDGHPIYIQAFGEALYSVPQKVITWSGGMTSVFLYSRGATEANVTLFPQIELGSVATAYEPYRPTQKIETTHPLRGIPVTTGGNYTDANGQQWVCDEVDFERGVYVQRIGSVVFTEDDVLSTQANTIRLRRDISSINQSKGWCSITDNYVYNATLDTVHYYITGSNCWVFVPIGYDLNANRVELLYQFTAPIETPLTETEIAAYRALHSNKPNTTILNDSGAHMKVEYAADTKLYIDNKLAALVGNT